MSDSTTHLVRRHLDNDPSAFGQLVGRYYQLVFSVCMHVTGHRQDAEDALQETFTRVARALPLWDDSRPIEPWLVTIARNRCRSLLSRRRPLYSLTIAAEPESNDAELEQSANVLAEEIRLAVESFPDKHREAFRLFHEHQLTYQEIADRLNCPLGTVKTWVRRARRDLIGRLRQRDVLGEAVQDAV